VVCSINGDFFVGNYYYSIFVRKEGGYELIWNSILTIRIEIQSEIHSYKISIINYKEHDSEIHF
jgi:hypothetical protein